MGQHRTCSCLCNQASLLPNRVRAHSLWFRLSVDTWSASVTVQSIRFKECVPQDAGLLELRAADLGALSLLGVCQVCRRCATSRSWLPDRHSICSCEAMAAASKFEKCSGLLGTEVSECQLAWTTVHRFEWCWVLRRGVPNIVCVGCSYGGGGESFEAQTNHGLFSWW